MIQDIKNQIAKHIGLSQLEETGTSIVRNEARFRINEKEIQYYWVLLYSHLYGNGLFGLFGIKFEKSKFRDQSNPEELIQGVFNFKDNNTAIDALYFESDVSKFEDTMVSKLKVVDLFKIQNFEKEETSSIIECCFESVPISINFKSRYVQSEHWNDLNNEIVKLSKSLSEKSKNRDFQLLTKGLTKFQISLQKRSTI